MLSAEFHNACSALAHGSNRIGRPAPQAECKPPRLKRWRRVQGGRPVLRAKHRLLFAKQRLRVRLGGTVRTDARALGALSGP